MKEVKAVRCGNKNATPYLRKHIDLFTECAGDDGHIVDIGCGNGRNTEYLKELGFKVLPLDAVNDYGIRWFAGSIIPTEAGSADCVLCNYLLMFLDHHARNDVYDEITRISHKETRLLIELEMVKQSWTPDVDTLHALNDEVSHAMIQRGWRSIHGTKNRWIFEKIV